MAYLTLVGVLTQPSADTSAVPAPKLHAICEGPSAARDASGALSGDFNVGDSLASEGAEKDFFIHLTGASAEALYDHMDVEAIDDACADDGTKTKYQGNIQCSKSVPRGDVECWFALNPRTPQVRRGVIC